MPRLLIVDDSPTTRRLLRTLLEQQGYEICGEAEDGIQAIDLAKQLKPDLVLLECLYAKVGRTGSGVYFEASAP